MDEDSELDGATRCLRQKKGPGLKPGLGGRNVPSADLRAVEKEKASNAVVELDAVFGPMKSLPDRLPPNADVTGNKVRFRQKVSPQQLHQDQGFMTVRLVLPLGSHARLVRRSKQALMPMWLKLT